MPMMPEGTQQRSSFMVAEGLVLKVVVGTGGASQAAIDLDS